MMMLFVLPFLVTGPVVWALPPVAGQQSESRCESKRIPQHTRCTGCPPMADGKLCASTTRYNDQTKAACGCGPSDPVPPDWWTLTKMTAAINCKNLDPEHPLLSWCPEGCGGCYKLCSTGGTTQGKPTKAGVCQVFKVTNRCGDGYDLPGGRDWCSQHMTWRECERHPEECKKEGNTNWFGYPVHFDLQDFHFQVSDGLGWDNVEVTFEPVPCQAANWTGPDWDCMCNSTRKVVPTAPPVTTTTTSPPPPQRCASAFKRCGGKGHSGPTCCEPGCQCTAANIFFWQECVPPLGKLSCNESNLVEGFVRRDAAGIAWVAEGKMGIHDRSVGLTIVSGGLILAIAAVATLAVVSLAAFGAAVVRQRWRGSTRGSSRLEPLGTASRGATAGVRSARLPTSRPEQREPDSPVPMLC